jgi:KDO2-lipid IV(A) lauroyltransferase
MGTGLFAAGVWLAELFPAALVYRAASWIGWLVALLPLPPRRRLRRNLARVIDAPPSAAAVRAAARRAYQTQALNYADLLRSRRMVSADVARRFEETGDGWPALRRLQDERRGLVLVTAHFGRIELLTHHLGHLGIRLTLPVERLAPPALFELVCRLRAKPTFRLVPHDAALRPCLRALAQGDAAVLFADWDSTGHGVLVRFFGVPTRLPAGPAILARRAGAPLLVGYAEPGPRPETFRTVIEPPLAVEWTDDQEADVRRATQMIADAFERFIRRFPERWVMFHEIWPHAAGGVVECGAST